MERENNPQKLRALFDAYLDWELDPYTSTNESVEQIRARALHNFDFISQHADDLVTAVGNKTVADNLTVYGDQTKIGRVRRFYRQAIGCKIPPLKPDSDK